MKYLICQECPNGCSLSLQWKDAENVFISGNQCAHGVAFAARIISREKKSVVQAETKTPLFSQEILRSVVSRWQVRLKKLHYKIPIQGSPERTVFRVVLEDENGHFFILEQIPSKSLERKKEIAAILDFLAKNNLARIHPYLTDAKGNQIIKHKGSFWQMTHFMRGGVFDRERYMYERWRGPVLAEFLIELRQKAQKMPFQHSQPVFSLKNYIYKLIREINLHNRNIKNEINDIAGFLEKDFLEKYEKLPVSFCHGDYHPLNMIWSDDDIRCVIDWEFCGYKREIYDMANLIGCIGVEDPQSLSGELVGSFTAAVKDAGLISKTSWKYLVEFIVALRFAWLSEWLRRKDSDMIRLELDYMRLLIDNKKDLQKVWL